MKLLDLERVRIPVRQGRRRAQRAPDAVAAKRAFARHLEALGVGLVGFDIEHRAIL